MARVNSRFEYLESIRIRTGGFSGFLRGTGAIVEFAVLVGCEPSEHEMRVADLNHGGAGSGGPFVVLAVPSASTVPSIGSLHGSEFANRVEVYGPRKW